MEGLRDELPELGQYMRGVADFNLYGNGGIFFKQTLPVRIFDWAPLGEFQIQPFSDFGLVPPSYRAFDAQKDMRLSTGLDLVAFPTLISSLSLRSSVGVDLFGPGGFTDRLELSLSTSLAY